MSNISGKLSQILLTFNPPGFTAEAGTIEFALCGYGNFNPKTSIGTSIGLIDVNVPVSPGDGSFKIPLIGNDVIQPAGTYYTYTVKDANGDIIQCEAYQFIHAQNYDMDFAVPFDPNEPPPPIPPAILDLLEVVDYSANPVFNGFQYPSWIITLTGDAAGTFQDLIDGNLYTIILCQDAAGGHAFTYSANVYNATPANPDPNGITIQTFVAKDNFLMAIGAGTWVTGGPLLAALQRWKP